MLRLVCHSPFLHTAMDDDDDFLYGSSAPSVPAQPIQVSQPSPIETAFVANGVVSHLEAEAENTQPTQPSEEPEDTNQNEEEEVEAIEESDDEDIEIIMEQPSRSLDLRQNRPPPANRSVSSTQPRPAPQPSVTTEYTPLQRAGSLQTQPSTGSLSSDVRAAPGPAPDATSMTPAPSISAPPAGGSVPQAAPKPEDDGIDTSKLPPAVAPPSHPDIDPAATGYLDGRSILEVDLAALTDKPWRKPGSDISDWFNYGFDEISWEAYCYRRRDLGEFAHVLKTSVLNFSGMPEEQVTALPHEVRQMVMTGTNAMLNNNTGPNPAMMGGMMDMSMMNPMGMGMPPDMGMMQGMMPDGAQGQGSDTPEPMMQDGYAGGPGMMMGDYGMQDPSQMGVQQQMYNGMESPAAPAAPTGPGRGGTPVPYRGRGGAGPRGGRGFARGRGARPSYEGGGMVRPASPLPPNVPTGPRNQNKYKDRDGNAPAVDGLDYGGGGGRTGSGEPEDRGRKRRGSPVEDVRGSKRR